jgi:hypothetical protein
MLGRRKPGTGLGLAIGRKSLSPTEDLFESFKPGGIGNMKSGNFTLILTLFAKRNPYLQESSTDVSSVMWNRFAILEPIRALIIVFQK